MTHSIKNGFWGLKCPFPYSVSTFYTSSVNCFWVPNVLPLLRFPFFTCHAVSWFLNLKCPSFLQVSIHLMNSSINSLKLADRLTDSIHQKMVVRVSDALSFLAFPFFTHLSVNLFLSPKCPSSLTVSIFYVSCCQNDQLFD